MPANVDQRTSRAVTDRTHTVFAVGVVVVVVTVCTVFATTQLPAGAATQAPVRRVLIVSLPGVAWPDLEGADIPNLSRLFRQSALGALVTRTAGRRTSAGGGYLTIGAGSRSDSDDLLVGQAFEPTERYGDTGAAEVFAQRTGHHAKSGLLHLGIEALVSENAQGRFDPQIGALGDSLARAHFNRGVIANADGAQPVVDGSIPQYQRSAVAALMTHEGVVPEGDVSDDLLVPSLGAPFGVRQNADAVLRAFDRSWKPKSVVMVEASDLLRTDLFGQFATSEQLRAQKLDALRRADVLVGKLLQRVDRARDAVLVLGPTSGRGGGLAVAALRAPGVAPDLLRSATSRRTGLVFLTDVAPTVLHLVGAARPARMEGQAMVIRGASGPQRMNQLVQLSRDGLARDGRTTPLSVMVVVLSGVLAVAAALALVRFPRRRPLVQIGAVALLGFLAATYLAGPLHVGRSGNSSYWAFVFFVAFAFAVVCRVAGRGRAYAPILIALAATVALHLCDLVIGARLELNTVFGYSPTVGIRTAGEGNLTFAQLGAATVLLSTLLVWRSPTRRVVYGVIVLLAVTLAVMVAPPFGDDFGAALAAFPAFALLAWLLLGRRVRVRTLAWLVAGVVVAALAVGFVDLLRPPDQRTHIGRFFSQVGREGFTGLFKVLHRKLDANLASFSTARLIWVLPIVGVFVVFIWLSDRTDVRRLVRDTAVLRQGLVALGMLMVLGYALNDSGISIPALMAVVFESVVVYLALERATPAPKKTLAPVQIPLRR